MMSLAESERPFCEVRFSVGRFRGPAVLCCRLDGLLVEADAVQGFLDEASLAFREGRP